MENEIGNKKIYLIHWNILSEWWHTDKDCTEEEILDTICGVFLPNKEDQDEFIATREQVRQRLFGGFDCEEGGYHIYHATGHYTYLGKNVDLAPQYREEIWKILIEGNADQEFHKEAPFTKDYPNEPKV